MKSSGQSGRFFRLSFLTFKNIQKKRDDNFLACVFFFNF